VTTVSLPRPVAFVLGGGGSLGAIQVGMLQALAEADFVPDLVVGTSVGSINGLVVALDPGSAAHRLSHIWPRITRHMVFPGGPLASLRTLQRERNHLFPNTGLRALMSSYLGAVHTFSDLALPLGVVTTDVATAAPHLVTEGDLLPALLASAAIPGIFPPVPLGHRLLYDGGVVANVPVTQALAMGAQSLVVLDTAFPGQVPAPPATLAEALFFTTMVTMRVQSVLEAPLAADRVPVVYLPGPQVHRVSPLEFQHTGILIKGGYIAARDFLAGLEVSGPGLYGPGSPRQTTAPGPAA
jgi:NTE family protein